MRNSALALSSRVMPAALFRNRETIPEHLRDKNGAIRRTRCRRTHGICEREAGDAQCCVPLILTSLMPTCLDVCLREDLVEHVGHRDGVSEGCNGVAV
jgi:hypothetical protein